MNTQQIDSLLKRDPFSKKIFKKVCALDQIEQPIFPSAYVINSDPSNKPGEHWVAVYFDKNGKGEYFDSYGLPPSFLDLDEYMNRHSRSWIWNRKTLQALFSTTCGHYCIYYILLRCRGIPLLDIVESFSSYLTENDRFITRFIRSLY